MTHEQHRAALAAGNVLHLTNGLLLEFRVADGEHFIDHQDFRLQVGGDGEAEPHLHAGRVAFDGSVDIAFAAGEIDDFVEFSVDLAPGHAHDGAVHVDVLAARHFRVEPGAHLEQRGDPPADVDLADGGRSDAREELQQRALARTVLADDADHVALLHAEIDVPQGPDKFSLVRAPGLANPQERVLLPQHVHRPPAVEVVAERARGHDAQAVLLPDMLEFDGFHTLDGVHEGALYFIENDYAEQEQQGHEEEAIAEGEPGEVSLPQGGIAEGLDDGRHRIEENQRAQRPFGHHTEWVDNRRGIHPELHDEGEENSQVAIFGSERRNENTETESLPRNHQHQQRRERERPGDGNLRSAEIENDKQHQEQPSLNQEAQQVGNHRGDGHHKAGEIDLPEHVLIRNEGIGGLLEAVGEIEPTDVARHVEENLRDAVGAHLGNAAEDEHVHQHGKHRLNQVPQWPEDGLLILDDDIAPHKEPDQIAVSPNLPHVDLPQLLVWSDPQGPGLIGCVFSHPSLRKNRPVWEPAQDFQLGHDFRVAISSYTASKDPLQNAPGTALKKSAFSNSFVAPVTFFHCFLASSASRFFFTSRITLVLDRFSGAILRTVSVIVLTILSIEPYAVCSSQSSIAYDCCKYCPSGPIAKTTSNGRSSFFSTPI